MTNAKLAAIYAVFKQHGVEIDQSAIWEVQGTPVVRHKDVERLGAALNIAYDEPKVLRSERDEAVILVIGRIGEKMEWSIGEALIGVNYRVSGKQAAYPWAMAEKRAKDRVILKLAQLHGNAYSEEEADEFKESSAPETGNGSHAPETRKAISSSSLLEKSLENAERELKERIERKVGISAITDFMQNEGTQTLLCQLPKDRRNAVRLFAKERLISFGWQPGQDS